MVQFYYNIIKIQIEFLTSEQNLTGKLISGYPQNLIDKFYQRSNGDLILPFNEGQIGAGIDDPFTESINEARIGSGIDDPFTEGVNEGRW
jgi:hypothetical protein